MPLPESTPDSTFWRKTGVQVTLLIVVLFLLLLGLIYYLVVYRGQQAFVRTMSGESVTLSLRDSPFRFATEDQSFPLSGTLPAHSAPDRRPLLRRHQSVAGVVQDEASGMITFQAHAPFGRGLQERFRDVFSRYLLSVMLVGFAGAIAVGYLVSGWITRPLQRLQEAMSRLRQSEHSSQLALTGNVEVDQVLQEFNRLSEDLRQAETLRRTLISDTSHEINTPLASLRLQLEGVRDGVLPWDQTRLKILLQQTERLVGLVEGLQEYSQLRSQSSRPQRDAVLFREWIEEILLPYHDRLQQDKIKLVLDIDPSAVLQADKKMLARLLTNLLDNTLRYAQAHTITLTYDGRMITFSDDGVGIAGKYLSNIFERFYRVDSARTRETGGLGLGLAIVREIAQAHGWQIEAVTLPPPGGLQLRIDTNPVR